MAEYVINITEQDVLNANSYLPITLMEQVTRNMAVLLMEPVEVDTSDGDVLPVMNRINRKLRAQFLMGVLATKLGREFACPTLQVRDEDGNITEQPFSWVMDDDDYDTWASSYVFNQLERMKKSKTPGVVDKLFDLLYDYKAVELALNGALQDELNARNDIFNRAIEFFSVEAVDAGIREVAAEGLRQARESEE